MAVGFLVAVAAAEQTGSAGALPDDPALDPVRPALEKIVADVTQKGLPPHPIINKVKEGLAKGVAAQVIRDAVLRQAQRLLGARHFLEAQRGPEPPFALVQALALAGEMGIDAAILSPLLSPELPSAHALAAVDAVCELTTHGYPSRPAAALVRRVAEREPTAIPRVLAGLDAIRGQTGGTPQDTLVLLQGRLTTDQDSFETAVTRLLEAAAQSPKTAKTPRPARRKRPH